jgi:L-arabinose isomerase
MKQPLIGLLPLYLELYDQARKAARPRVEEFYRQIADEIAGRGVKVEKAPVCRLDREFRAAIQSFEKAGVDAIVTLHLAYSPSLESIEALSATHLPLIVLDTTPSARFGPDTDPDEIMYNHGIHGVQDMCNLLLRRGKVFHIAAGHWRETDVIDQAVAYVRSAVIASSMRQARVGLIGEPFRGMGDFAVPPEALKNQIGIDIQSLSPSRLKNLLKAVTDSDVAREKKAYSQRYAVGQLAEETYSDSVRLSLALGKWVEEEHLAAWTFNFLSITRTAGYPTVPFLAASRLMAQGIGYAGEGDVLTAALVGSLASLYPDTSFTEMFCPDWKRGAVFLSHMGEMNPHLVSGKAQLHEKEYEFSDTGKPVVLTGCFRQGEILLVDLAPQSQDNFRLICSPAAMLDVDEPDRLVGTVRGWFKPALPLPEFLSQYSRLGGTHHLALVYGADTAAIQTFGNMMGWETCLLH